MPSIDITGAASAPALVDEGPSTKPGSLTQPNPGYPHRLDKDSDPPASSSLPTASFGNRASGPPVVQATEPNNTPRCALHGMVPFLTRTPQCMSQSIIPKPGSYHQQLLTKQLGAPQLHKRNHQSDPLRLSSRSPIGVHCQEEAQGRELLLCYSSSPKEPSDTCSHSDSGSTHEPPC